MSLCGIPEIDTLNEEFLFDAANGDTSWWSSSCGWMSAAATTFYRSKGYEAEGASVSADELETIGYGDRLLDPPNGPHAFTVLVVASGERYLVDFTAGQYGYKQFPMVSRRLAGGSWKRLTV